MLCVRLNLTYTCALLETYYKISIIVLLFPSNRRESLYIHAYWIYHYIFHVIFM